MMSEFNSLVELKKSEVEFLFNLVKPALRVLRSDYQTAYRMSRKYDVNLNELHREIEVKLDVVQGASDALEKNLVVVK